jgi:hypothetical protein
LSQSDEVERLKREFSAASKRLTGASGKSAPGIEKGYGQAYQALVRVGAAPQIKHKYR